MEKEKKHTGIKIFCLFIIVIVCFYLYGRYINPTELKVKEQAIINKSLPQDYNGLKIAQFSDLHYGRTTDENTLKKLIKELNLLNTDIIIFNGDLFDQKNISQKEEERLIKFLKQINSKIIKLAVIGDYDKYYLNTYKKILEASNFLLLDNSSKLIYNKSHIPINFIGLTDYSINQDLFTNDYFNITIMHEPDNIKYVNHTKIAFAGHSLGGQIRIPFIGGIKKIKGATTYLESHYQVKESDLYISNGIGTQDYSFRFFNPPSITLYRLYNS